ncbi:MAG: heparinase II/III family protein [Spirochaetes bacterium]|nr:heparinase II/III family protein [Spirochaetota bacterium]
MKKENTIRNYHCFFVIAFLTFANAAADTIHLESPGFEKNIDGWENSGGNGMSVVSADAKHSGDYGLRINDANVNAGSSLYSARFKVTAGNFYQTHFWARCVSGDGIGVYLLFYNKEGKSFSFTKEMETKYKLTPFILPKDQGDWKEYILRKSPPEGAVEGQLWIHSFNSSQVTADFDDFRLIELSAAEAAAMPLKPSDDLLPWPGKVELPKFTKEKPDRAFEALKVYDEKNSPLRVPRENWEKAKAIAAEDETWKQWVQTQRTDLEQWMSTCKENVEWKTGWWHDFVSPKNGSFITFTPEIPGDTLSSPSDPSIKVTPKIFGAWVFGFRSRHAGKILQAARFYRLTGEEKFAEWAASQLDFYAEHFTEWPVQNTMGTSRIMRQGLDEAVNLTQYINAARTLGPFVTAERKLKWSRDLFKPEALLLNQSFSIIHNIACWQRSASAQAAIYCEDEALWKIAVDDTNGIRDQVARGITSDYLWYEQSMGYNSYVVSALAPFFRYALLTGRGESLKPEMQSIENLMLAPIMMRFPNGQIPNPADATSSKPQIAPGTRFLSEMADLFPTKLGRRQRSQDKNWSTLLDPPEPRDAEAGDTAPPSVSLNMESSRMAILCEGPWQVYFHYGQLNASHAQAEALNYELAYNKIDVSHDPGTVGYGSPLHGGYYTRGVCHNVPLVDGFGQQGWHPGRLDRFSPTAVTASQPKYRPNAEASRTLSIAGKQFIDTVAVNTLDGKDHNLGVVLHLQGKLRLTSAFAPDAGFAAAHAANGFQYWNGFQSARFTDKAVLEFDCQDAGFQIELQLAGAFSIVYASAPDYPPTRRDVLYIETQGKTLTLKTIISPSR